LERAFVLWTEESHVECTHEAPIILTTPHCRCSSRWCVVCCAPSHGAGLAAPWDICDSMFGLLDLFCLLILDVFRYCFCSNLCGCLFLSILSLSWFVLEPEGVLVFDRNIVIILHWQLTSSLLLNSPWFTYVLRRSGDWWCQNGGVDPRSPSSGQHANAESAKYVSVILIDNGMKAQFCLWDHRPFHYDNLVFLVIH
jgi:hypothetical protein